MPRLRFSTSTLAGGEIVPWLASSGELAYSPHSPPERDYYFQYSWVIPAIFRAGVNLRRHFWFGGPLKDSPEVRLLFTFWNNARRGEVEILYLSNGMAGVDEVRAPLAVYRHSEAGPLKRERLILLQHGSYLIAGVESQRYLDRGEAVLYRGVQVAKEFFLRRLTSANIRSRFNDRTFMLGDFCHKAGLQPKAPIASLLYSGYALEEWCAVRKFGPSYVKFRTPLSNLRITTFVCNETEVKVIDPNKLDVIEAVGCKVREVCI
jgi:hypothetical protein